MSARMRILFACVAVGIGVIAAIVIGRGGEDDAGPATTTVAATVGSTEITAPEPKPKPKPKPVLLKAGSIKTISVDKGDTVRFRAISPTADELHVHGYDTTWPLQPGKVRTVSFKATLDGQYEIELHGSGEQVARLRVQP